MDSIDYSISILTHESKMDQLFIFIAQRKGDKFYSFLAGALAPFLAGRGFWDLAMTAARRRAALVRSFLYLCLLRTALTLWRDLLAPAFMVVWTIDLPGLKAFLDLLVVRTNLKETFYETYYKFEAARNFWLKFDLKSVEGYFQESGNLWGRLQRYCHHQSR